MGPILTKSAGGEGPKPIHYDEKKKKKLRIWNFHNKMNLKGNLILLLLNYII